MISEISNELLPNNIGLSIPLISQVGSEVDLIHPMVPMYCNLVKISKVSPTVEGILSI
jgi:hypothetical protein